MFNKSLNYNTHALLQKQIAFDLVQIAKTEILNAKCVLDLGCGTGFIAKEAKLLNPFVLIEGVDASPEMLTQAKPLYNNLWLADITKFKPNKIYDCVLSSMCLQWIENKNDVILKYQNTPFFFAIPTINSLTEIKSCFEKINKPSPILDFKTPLNLKPCAIKIYKQEFKSLLSALQSFNFIGAKNTKIEYSITHNEIKKMEDYFSKITTWEIAYYKVENSLIV